MEPGITRIKALELLYLSILNQNTRKHCLATEAVMHALAPGFHGDPLFWGLAGLLHDLDIEITHADLSVHGQKTVSLLEAKGVHPEIITAIALHNECSTDQKRSTPLQHALAAGETMTVLISETALMYPDHKLASVTPDSIVNRMHDKTFATSVNRDIILECGKINISLPDFAEVCLMAMQGIHEKLGL
jgi:uncharacterized protein